MSSKFKIFDILGVHPVIYYDSQRRKKTLIGGVMSIITLILIFLITLYFILEVISKTSYSVIYNQMTGLNLTLNFSNIPYAFGIFSEKGLAIENLEKKIRIYGEFIRINITDNVYHSEKFVFDLEKCEKRHFNEYMNLIEKKDIFKDFYCLPLNTYDFTLFGNFQDFLSANTGLYIKITKYCNDQQNRDNILYTNCLNNTDLDINFGDIYINTIFLDYEIDHTNNINPVKITLKSQIFPISPQSFNQYSIKKRVVNYISNEGYFFNDIKEFTFYQDDSMDHYTDLQKVKGQDGLLVSFSISLSRKTDFHYRNYLKLQTALANIGGIAQGVFFTFSNLLKFIMKNDYFFDLGILSYIISEETSNENLKSDKIFVKTKNLQFNGNLSLNLSRKRDNTNKSNFGLKVNYLNENLNESHNNSNNNIFAKKILQNKESIKNSRRKSIEIHKHNIEKSYLHFLPCLKKSQKKINELLEVIIKKDLSVESLIRLINSQEFLNKSLIEKNMNDCHIQFKNLNKNDNLLKSQILHKLHNNEEIKKIKNSQK